MKKLLIPILVVVFICLGGLGYTAWWFTVASIVKKEIANTPEIRLTSLTGFPGPVEIHGSATFAADWQGQAQNVIVPAFTLKSMPFKGAEATLTLPQGAYAEGSLDRSIWSIDKLELRGPLPLDLPAQTDTQSLTLWRDAKGQITVNHFSFEKLPLKGEGAGLLTLDDKLQPTGQMNARLNGHLEYLHFLVEKGMVEQKDAMLASTILGGLSSPDESSGNTHIDIGIRLLNRTLYAGPLAVAQLPEIYWDSGNQPASHQSPDAGLPVSE